MKDLRDLGFRPNRIPVSARLLHAGLSLFLVAYGGLCVLVDDLFIPRERGRELHLHGLGVWIMCGALVMAALNLLSVVVDHYDARNNERQYGVVREQHADLGLDLFRAGFASVVLPLSPADGRSGPSPLPQWPNEQRRDRDQWCVNGEGDQPYEGAHVSGLVTKPAFHIDS